MRPRPTNPEAMRPSAGPMIVTPRSFNTARFAWVAGWLYMPPSMAGATSSGQRAASAVTLSRLSAIPCASFARVFAEAGAIINRSRADPQPNVLDVAFAAPQVGVGISAPAGHGLESQRGDELQGGCGQQDVDSGGGLGQLGGQVGGFIGGDRAGDAKQDIFIDERICHGQSPE